MFTSLLHMCDRIFLFFLFSVICESFLCKGIKIIRNGNIATISQFMLTSLICNSSASSLAFPKMLTSSLNVIPTAPAAIFSLVARTLLSTSSSIALPRLN